jgi:hypothetical protein
MHNTLIEPIDIPAALFRGALFVLIFAVSCPGCLGDQVLDSMNGDSDTGQDGDDDVNDDDGSGDADSDTDSDADSDGDADTDLDSGLVFDGDYSDWVNGADDWAPGEVISIVDEQTHPNGWRKARCFACHGVGKPWEPVTSVHNPRMQYWSWSCARGFPGGTCHGHGPNTTWQFNHNYPNDLSFMNCTKAGCHDVPFGGSFRDNHGFNKAPDPFCNACHQLSWTDWPDGGVI